MIDQFSFRDFPLWATGLFLVIVFLVALEAGYRLGLKQYDNQHDVVGGGNNIVLSSMFTLMALILAFTYAAGVNRNESRKQDVVVEANALGTAFLRSNLVDDPGRTALKQALLDYARTRTYELGNVVTSKERQRRIQISAEQLTKVWPITEQIVRQRQAPGAAEVSLVAAVNNVIDMHTVRIAGIKDTLPRAVFLMLMLITAGSLAIGAFDAGRSGQTNRLRMTALAVALSGVMLVIFDFDRPSDGVIHVSQSSLNDVIAAMEADLTN
jgi:hypothetical protein